MSKVAVFAEGLTELIFVRSLLDLLFDASSIGYECISLMPRGLASGPRRHGTRGRDAFIQIIDVGGDGSLVGALKERASRLLEQGYVVLALRDVYCEKYKSLAGTEYSQTAVDRIITSVRAELESWASGPQIVFRFAIMEIEAWFLGVPGIIGGETLLGDADTVEEVLGVDLDAIDPQTQFGHPSREFGAICRAVGLDYAKHRADIEAICSRLTSAAIYGLAAAGKCASFKDFLASLAGAIGAEYLYPGEQTGLLGLSG